MSVRNRAVFDKCKDQLPFNLDFALQVLTALEPVSVYPSFLPFMCQARSLTELDERLIVPMFGYTSWQQYYRHASPIRCLKDICIPYLSLNAEDDPFSPGRGKMDTIHGRKLCWLSLKSQTYCCVMDLVQVNERVDCILVGA